MPTDTDLPPQVRVALYYRRLAIIASALFVATAAGAVVAALVVLPDLKAAQKQTQADVTRLSQTQAQLSLKAQECQLARHELAEMEVQVTELEARRTEDYTAKITADQFLAMVDCSAACVEEPRGDPLCDQSEDMTDLMMGVCALGWLQASDLMSESEGNYQSCRRELERYL